jgi:putative tryptophan/tyrosine transport system substrate-binding protein
MASIKASTRERSAPMKKLMFLAFTFLLLAASAPPCFAEEKKVTIEVLQVTDIDVFNQAYQGFLQELKNNGYVQGVNLTVNRKIIPFDVEKGGIWDKIKVKYHISSEASRIAAAKPDLVLTMGTPSTKYARDKIIAAGIPLVFTAVAIPQAAGCKSLTEAGPGFTGATLYMDMNSVFKIINLAFPREKTAGIIHSDDENGIAQAREAQDKARAFGIKVILKEVKKTQDIKPVAEDLIKQGVEMFLLPLDTYYGLKGNLYAKELAAISVSSKVPVISLVMNRMPGGILYVGSDFPSVGALSGKQAAQILKKTAVIDRMPIVRMDQLKIMVDTEAMKALGIQLPLQILQIAKDVK